jgi:Fanconi anemia group M protein
VLRIDDREPEGLRLQILQACRDLGVDAKVTTGPERLTYADYVIDYPVDGGSETLGIERKTIGDFFGSFASGRLHKQLDGIKGTYSRAALLLEGDFDVVRTEGKMRFRIGGRSVDYNFLAIKNYLLSIQFGGVVLIPTRSEQETVTQIVGLHQMLQKERSSPVLLPVAPRDRSLRHDVACMTMIPGLGPKTAAALIERFHSIAGIVLASDQEIRAVKGVGEMTVRNLRLVLGTPDTGVRAEETWIGSGTGTGGKTRPPVA